MATSSLGMCGLLALGCLLVGCSPGSVGSIEPKLSTEGECYVATDPVRCRMAHDLAGGYPFQVVGTDR